MTESQTRPIKQRDRQRPFLRLRPRPAAKKPDGDGVACGCVPPSIFGTDFDALRRAFLQQEAPAVEWIHTAIQAARAILAVSGVGLAIVVFLGDVLNTLEEQIITRIVRILLPRATRAIPQWVPVTPPPRNATPDQLRERNAVATQDQIVEVAGIVERSYQNSIEAPFFQWHRWLNWTFHIRPDDGFANALAPINSRRSDFPDRLEGTPLVANGVIECQFDAGALWFDHGRWDRGNDQGELNFLFFARERSGPMMESDIDRARDWAWPMAGQFVWVAGRWVYNCSQASTGDANGRMATMLNPCKAIATARLVGHQFKENPLPVPATQFMFFISKRGGYIDFDTINDQDYEFIVDLPDFDAGHSEPYEIGRTNKIPPFSFDHNTIVVRPRLLKEVNTGAFLVSTTRLDALGSPVAIASSADQHMPPIVELVKPEKPGETPTHAKVTIRTSQLDPKLESYGFILSLGWFDPAGSQTERIRRCTVTLRRVTSLESVALGVPFRRDTGEVINSFLDDARPDAVAAMARVIEERSRILGVQLIPHAAAVEIAEGVWAVVIGGLKEILSRIGSDEDWLFRVGVNGMWRSFFFDRYDVAKGRPFQGDPKFEFLQLTTEPIQISMNGVEIDEAGRIMGEPRSSRRLDVQGVVSPGDEIRWEHLVVPGDSDAQIAANRTKLVFRYMGRIVAARLDDNDPLGFVEKRHFPIQDGKSELFELCFVPGVSREQQIVFVRDRKDYALFYQLDVSKIDPSRRETG